MIPQVELFSFVFWRIKDTKKTFRNQLNFSINMKKRQQKYQTMVSNVDPYPARFAVVLCLVAGGAGTDRFFERGTVANMWCG